MIIWRLGDAARATTVRSFCESATLAALATAADGCRIADVVCVRPREYTQRACEYVYVCVCVSVYVLVCSKKLISGQEEEEEAAAAAAAAEASAVAWLSFRSRGSLSQCIGVKRDGRIWRQERFRCVTLVSFRSFVFSVRSLVRPPSRLLSSFSFATEIVKISIWKLGNDTKYRKQKIQTKTKQETKLQITKEKRDTSLSSAKGNRKKKVHKK